MISRTLSTSRKFAQLNSEFSQVLYVLVVAHADDFGRQSGDAFTVKHQVFPTSNRPEADFEAALLDMEGRGLIQRYHAGGDVVLQVIGFEQHQVGLHKRSASRFPELPGNSGKFPGIPSEEKRREEKGTEEKGTAAPLITSPMVYAKRLEHCAFVGSRLEVPKTLHIELRKQLGGTDPDQTLEAWYLRLNGELDESGEPIVPDIFKWLKFRFAAWQKPTGPKPPSPEHLARMLAIERGERKR